MWLCNQKILFFFAVLLQQLMPQEAQATDVYIKPEHLTRLLMSEWARHVPTPSCCNDMKRCQADEARKISELEARRDGFRSFVESRSLKVAQDQVQALGDRYARFIDGRISAIRAGKVYQGTAIVMICGGRN